MGRNSGWVTAVAFLLVSFILLFGFGWEVGGRYAGSRYSMILIMHWCNFGSALAGGLAMGWMLVGEWEKLHFKEDNKIFSPTTS